MKMDGVMRKTQENSLTTKINNNYIKNLPNGVIGFSYDRSTLKGGILHIGVGNFHRAHQAWYLHKLFEKGIDTEWAIIGSGVLPFDEIQRSKLINQDYLTTLVELDPSGISAEVVGSMIDYIPVEKNNRSLVTKMADPNIRIVSLTITEGGYYLDPILMRLDINNPEIKNDIKYPESPQTVFGAMIKALSIRKEKGFGPFTGLSCDNISGNGTILRNNLLSMAVLIDKNLAKWIEEKCSFPNSMVDCIVPKTGPVELNLVKSFGIVDEVPVTHEKFRQWVVEDNFCAGRPKLEKVGVIFTKNVGTYETMKLRILNGGHQIIANVGEILSIKTISECMTYPEIKNLFLKITSNEITPNIKGVPNMTPNQYIKLIKDRFSNNKILDTTRRVAFDGSSRHPVFVIPSIQDAIRADSPISGLALVEASWARMCYGVREDGSHIIPNDPNWIELKKFSKKSRKDPLCWIYQKQYYGNLGNNTKFSDLFSFWLNMIWKDGMKKTIKYYLSKKKYN